MKLTPEQEAKIRWLSDNHLYQKAQNFVNHCQRNFIEGKQQAGILEFSHTWKELNAFIHHQKSRDWETISKKKAHYKLFYATLEEELQELLKLVTQEKFVTGEVPSIKAEQKKYNDEINEVAGLLAHEFIQHVVAEMRWQQDVVQPSETQQQEEQDYA